MINNEGTPPSGTGWKTAWHDGRHSAVHINEDDGLVSVQLPPCEHHDGRSFCRHCMPRLAAASDAARRCLDPQAEPLLEEIKAEGTWREFVALHNPIAKNAFAMRFDVAMKVSALKTIFTTKKDTGPFERLKVVSYTTQSKVCDANHLRAFRVRLKDGPSEAFTKRLWDARLSFIVDGERLVDKVRLKDLLGMHEVVLSRPVPEKTCLFNAIGLTKGQQADDNDWLGYMCPNGTNISAEIEDVPSGGGLVQLEVSWDLVSYSTKKKV